MAHLHDGRDGHLAALFAELVLLARLLRFAEAGKNGMR